MSLIQWTDRTLNPVVAKQGGWFCVPESPTCAAGIPLFVKQYGAVLARGLGLRDPKGGIGEFRPEQRIRAFPFIGAEAHDEVSPSSAAPNAAKQDAPKGGRDAAH